MKTGRVVASWARLLLVSIVASALFQPGAQGLPEAGALPLWFAYHTWGPEGENLDVYVRGALSVSPIPIAVTAADEYSPALSPDSGQVAFVRNESDDANLFVAAADGSSEEQLTSGPATDGGPTWSPDGESIAFWSDDGTGHPEIYVTAVAGNGELIQLTSNDYVDVQPAWSPDGSKIAFTRNMDGKTDIWVVDVDTGVESQLTQGGIYSLPDWMPDGSDGLVALLTHSESDPWSLAHIDSEGQATTIRADIGLLVSSLGSYPNGILLSVAQSASDSFKTLLVDPISGQLLASIELEGEPAW